MEDSMTRMPVLVVAGFLGAGKTTFINQLLAQKPAGQRVGVIVNDFGRINIDGKQLRQGADPVVELSGGCVCCSLQVGLSQAVRTLAAREDLDRLVIEASGISVLSALVQALSDEDLAGRIRIVQLVVMIDARRYLAALRSLPVIQDQIAHAHLILLNHSDEVANDLLAATVERLKTELPRAVIVVTRQGRLPWERIWAETPFPQGILEPGHHHEHWLAYEITLPAEIDPSQVLHSLDQLPEVVERVKGVWSGANELLVFQKVGPQPATLERRAGASSAGTPNALVALARQPIDDDLQRIFAGWATVGPAQT